MSLGLRFVIAGVALSAFACAEAGQPPDGEGGGGAASVSSSASASASVSVSTTASTTASSSSSASTASSSGSGMAACNNGVIEAGEDCDFDSQGDPLVSATCASLGFPMSGANPGCGMDCLYDIQICRCGDGALHALEACDGDLFGTNTCQTEGFAGGNLACTPDCELDTSGCNGCGNGTTEAGEECDDGNMMSGDGCSDTCTVEVLACDPDGTYVIQGAPFAYTCCNGLVSINVSSFIFSQNGAMIGSSPSNPVSMTGSATTCPAGSFNNTGSIPGGCTETYTVSGSYLDADTWSGTYQVQFTGADCSCFGGMLGTPCVGQLFSVTAMR